MNIALLCYPTYGGSGVVATELGQQLASMGHQVHIVSYDQPIRLQGNDGVIYHNVDIPSYPLFHFPPYIITLASKIHEIHSQYGLDIIHAHYAIPHAVAGYLARQMLPEGPKLVTTLHGTDITLLGSEPGFRPAVTFSINNSDVVTAVSDHLRMETKNQFNIERPIELVYNFIDTDKWQRRFDRDLRAKYACDAEKLIVHVSNFRPVKQPKTVIDVFFGISKEVNAKLLLVGDGPELCPAYSHARELGIADRVIACGNQNDIIGLLSIADLFLLPSKTESFGLAALEAMACEVVVVASDTGGLPEVIESGTSGFLCPPDNVFDMVEKSVLVLTDDELHYQLARSARQRARDKFAVNKWVAEYARLYEQATGATAAI